MASNLPWPTLFLLPLFSSILLVIGADYTNSPGPQVAYYHYPVPSQRPVGLRQGVARKHYQSSHGAAPNVARQFVAPALEQAAFKQALSNQGYVFQAAGPSAAAARTGSTARGLPAGISSSGSSVVSPSLPTASTSDSLNVKLPVPFGITPLNIAQLPLQAGAPYSTLPRTTGLTSYGTPQIQRR